MKLTSQVFFSSPSFGSVPRWPWGCFRVWDTSWLWIDFQLQMFSVLSPDNMLSRAALWVRSVLGRGSSRKGQRPLSTLSSYVCSLFLRMCLCASLRLCPGFTGDVTQCGTICLTCRLLALVCSIPSSRVFFARRQVEFIVFVPKWDLACFGKFSHFFFFKIRNTTVCY